MKTLFIFLALIVYAMSARIRNVYCIDSCLKNNNCFNQKEPDPCMDSCQNQCKQQGSPELNSKRLCLYSCGIKKNCVNDKFPLKCVSTCEKDCNNK